MSAAEVLNPIPKLVREDVDNSDNYEIIDGVRVELPPMSADSQALAFRLAHHVTTHGIAQNLGEAYTEMLFKLPLPNTTARVCWQPMMRLSGGNPMTQQEIAGLGPALAAELGRYRDCFAQKRT